MLARSGLIGCPCPVPVSLTSSLPSSMAPTRIHFPIKRSTLPSVTPSSIISTSADLTIESKDPTTHYPPQRPSRTCHHHSPPSSLGRKKTGCLWATPLSRQVASDPDFAQRRSLTHTQGVDRPQFSHAGFVGPGETQQLSRFH